MSPDRTIAADPRAERALLKLQNLIQQRYPTATFATSRSADEPENIHLIATVDVDDPDEVLDLVMDQLIELQVDERIPVHVIPIRTPARVLADMEAGRRREWPVRRVLSRRAG
ncbi:MAG: hypothetical protein HY690_14920 [Chloroflexi bacterium]|nr:hypothetical protein [Chloroflexota bacterium]